MMRAGSEPEPSSFSLTPLARHPVANYQQLKLTTFNQSPFGQTSASIPPTSAPFASRITPKGLGEIRLNGTEAKAKGKVRES